MTEHDETELCQILSTNPFLDELDDWRKDLALYNEGQKKLEDLEFVLSSDKVKHQNYFSSRSKTSDYFLHSELIPQPFIGDPCAPVWYLLLNPGYSEIDLYDHLGVCPCCKRKLFIGEASKEDALFDKDRDRLDALVKRQEMLIGQLRLGCGKPFYLLDDSFRTLSDNSMIDAKKGGFGWWRTVLFGANGDDGFLLPECGVGLNAESVGRKLFVLECSPYHSVKFDGGVQWTESKYSEFWATLISWAVSAGKKFIVRSKRVYELLAEKHINVNHGNSANFSSWRNVSLTKKNLKGEQKLIDDICQALRDE